MDIHFFAKTDIGRVRSGNEDYFLNEKIADEEFLFCVADGMGGHLAGDVASRIACEKFVENYKSSRRKKLPIPEAMEFSIRRANQAILKKAEDDPMKKGMGTTFSAVVILEKKACIIHIGDSRVYFIREGHIKRLTTDHTFVEKLVENGRISIEEAREHPQKNVLYMSLGARDGFFPEIIKDFAIQDGDAFVICSDGLSNMVDEELIKKVVLSMLPEDAAEELVHIANSSGGNDNITLQVVRIGSIESLEKTKPVKIASVKRNRLGFLILIGLALIVSVLWVLLRQFDSPAEMQVGSESAVKGNEPETERRASVHDIEEINSEILRRSIDSPAKLLFLSNNKLVFEKSRGNSYIDLLTDDERTFGLANNEMLIPSSKGDLFIFRKRNHSRAVYSIVPAGDPEKALFTLSPPIEVIAPLFLNDTHFIFTDFQRVLAVKGWKEKPSGNVPYFPILEITVQENDRFFFKKNSGYYTMTIYQPGLKSVRVFNMDRGFERVFQIDNLHAEIPLAVEYLDNRSVIFYYSTYSAFFSGDSHSGQVDSYRFPNYQSHISSVLVDTETGKKLFVSDDLRFFLDELKT